MKIEFDTSALSPLDFQVLAILGGVATAPAGEAKAAVTTPAPAKKAAAAKKAEPEAKAEEPEDLMEQAVQKATKMVSDGKAADVKAALATAGARRVSELKSDDDIRTFLDALS